jgi:hypothetical protein
MLVIQNQCSPALVTVAGMSLLDGELMVQMVVLSQRRRRLICLSSTFTTALSAGCGGRQEHNTLDAKLVASGRKRTTRSDQLGHGVLW